jgi:hypothetical protein
MATSGTYYLNAPSLVASTSVYTDAALTTVAPDGFYSDGANVRELVSGVFTNVFDSCSGCPAPCNSVGNNFTETGDKIYYMTKKVGGTVLDTGAVIIEIYYNTNEIPVGFNFIYNNVNYQSFSSQNFGLLQPSSINDDFIFVGDATYDCGITSNTYNASVYTYDPVNNVFVSVGTSQVIYVPVSAVQITPSSPGKLVMVIPKPTASPDFVGCQIVLLCPSARDFDVVVNCPANLPSFTSSSEYALSGDACGAGTFETYYAADVNGTTKAGGYLDYYDWVFSDSFGQNVLPNGFYRSPSASNGWFEVQDGVIVAFGGGCAYPEWRIDYQVENAILGACNVNITNLFLEISQPPFPSYVNNNAPSTGSVLVPEGLTHIQLRAQYNNTYSPCGQLRMVIERNGVIIASKTYTPTISAYEYLDVDINLDDDASIYGYITLA